MPAAVSLSHASLTRPSSSPDDPATTATTSPTSPPLPMAARPSLLTLAAAAIPAAGASPSASALFALRVASPAVVFLATLSLVPSKPLSPPSPSPITSVVVQSRVPRKSVILSLLYIAALSFLVDGLAYAAYAALNGVWRPGTGVELAALLGLIAYTALAALGTYKDVNNVEIWSRKRVRGAVFIALALDVAQVVLLSLSVATRDPRGICGSSKPSVCVPETLHFITPIVRVVVLAPLFFVLLCPRVVYIPVESHPETVQVESAPLVGHSGVLLQEESNEAASGCEVSKYGTFAPQGQPESCAVATCARPESSLTIFWRLCPYVLPARGLISLIALSHLLTRVLIPLLPLSLGAALNGFVSSSSSPIPTPFGPSPYPYIFLFALLHLLVSGSGVPNLTKALVSRLGAGADDALSSRYTDHVLGLALGSSKAKVSEESHATAGDAIAKALHAVSTLAAVFEDGLIGVVVLAVLFGWEFGLIVLIALGVFGYITCLATRPFISSWPGKPSIFAFVQALFGSCALLLGSLYIARGVTEGIWSPGAWVAWVWYWSILFLPLIRTPSLRVATSDVRSIFQVLDKPAKIADGKGAIDGSGGVAIKFDNVSLTYPYTDTQEPVSALTDVSFILPAASVTAIVSASGSAGSSILKALYRLYDVDSGSIHLNDVPIHSFSLTSLRSVVAVVPDICSEGRTKALSRAFGKGAKVVLVEGPLDRAFVGDRTILWELGSNGLDGVDGVDQILVLKDGKLVESGPFKELVQADGLFASLWADHSGTGAPVPGSSSATVSGPVEGYDTSTINPQPTDEAPAAEAFPSDEPHDVTASVREPSVRAATASIRAPSIKPTASVKTESVAPTLPTKDVPYPINFPSALREPEPVTFPISSDVITEVSPAPAPIAFPKTDDSRSIDSGSQTHVRLPTSITFETTATPPRVSTPDPTGTSSSSTPDAEGKRKRISSQNFQRLARRISLSTPKKGAGIPGIAGIAGVLRRDASVKLEKSSGENGTRQSTDATGGSSSAPETARSSGEIGAERTEKDKEREEKKRKRKSFMEVVGAKRGDSGAPATPPATDVEPQPSSTGEA